MILLDEQGLIAFVVKLQLTMAAVSFIDASTLSSSRFAPVCAYLTVAEALSAPDAFSGHLSIIPSNHPDPLRDPTNLPWVDRFIVLTPTRAHMFATSNLSDFVLDSYPIKNTSVPLESIALPGNVDAALVFGVSDKAHNRVWVLKAPSDLAKQEWVRRLRQAAASSHDDILDHYFNEEEVEVPSNLVTSARSEAARAVTTRGLPSYNSVMLENYISENGHVLFPTPHQLHEGKSLSSLTSLQSDSSGASGGTSSNSRSMSARPSWPRVTDLNLMVPRRREEEQPLSGRSGDSNRALRRPVNAPSSPPSLAVVVPKPERTKSQRSFQAEMLISYLNL
ncbi:hypothetical protein BC830DRAFT_1115845 [Chytriomyces sp. MP71]|nr:hypothetical protein BC830DRAFT_1115845 [Chytriomyces sp. MP71]